MNLTDEDRDLAIRTLFGEAATDPASQAAVAAVILNRAKAKNASIKDVVLAPKQFEPWGSRSKELLGLDKNSPEYIGLGNVFDAVASGKTPDPTGGATLFYAPKAQAKLERKAPAWDTGKGVDIGQHRFFAGSFPTPPASAAPIIQALGPQNSTASPPAILSALSAHVKPPLTQTAGRGGFALPPGLFDTGPDQAALAEAMELQGLPEQHISAVTGAKKVNGRWTL